ncbi:MAG: hypothetical protein II049_03620 [Clostridia bacterium]|nr:hypothetical protein [Clostridia bacterium]
MMKRFFLIPVFAALLALVGCTCSMNGSATMPSKAPSAQPTVSAAPTVQPTMSAMPTESAAPVMPTEPIVSPSAGTTAGN